MKICQVATGYTSIPAKTSAATEIVIEHLSNHLVKHAQDVVVIDIYEDHRHKMEFDIVDIKMPKGFGSYDYTHELGVKHKLKRVIYSLKVREVLSKIVHQEDIDVLHVHNQYNGFFLKKNYGKKKIFFVYTVHSHIWSRPWDEIKEKIKTNYWLERQCLKKADKVIVLNNFAKDNIILNLNIDEERIEVMANGVNTLIYKKLNSGEWDKKEFRSRYAKEDELILLHVGSFEKRKNQQFIIKNLKQINKIKRVKLLLIGQVVDKAYFKDLQDMIKENELSDIINVIGEVKPGKEINKFFNIADIFVFPSFAEAFSLVILEAMAVGLSVLCANIPSIKDVSKNSNDMVFFNLEDNGDFIRKIQHLLINDDYRREVGCNACNTVSNYYTWDKVSREYLNIYESLMQ